MHIVIATLLALIAGSLTDTARADPYRWCAQYVGEGGSTNCYFVTLEQCRAAVSGAGGLCLPNQFYDGRPVTTPDDFAPRRRRRDVR